MARIRTIKPSFFRHEALFEAEQETGLPLRVAFAGLWTAADREGRFKWAPRQLKLDCLPFDDVDFSRVLHALATRGFIAEYEHDGAIYGAIPSWSAHQVINNREAPSDLPEPSNINALTREARVDDATSTPLKHAQAEGKGREGERKGKEHTSSVGKPTRCDEAFEEFWKAYPRRDGANPKEPAHKLFAAAVRAGEDPQAIVDGAKRCAHADAGKIGTPYIPQAVKWLRDRRWRDYLSLPSPEQAKEALANMYYAKPESEQLDAWDAYSRSTQGKSCPRDRNGGWYVEHEWPPGHTRRDTGHAAPRANLQTMQ